jgi:hypothetical protein
MKAKSQTAQSSLKRRMRQFYNLLNEREFAKCHEMIDPRVRHRPESVTLLHYSHAAAEFLDQCGAISVVDSSVVLHLNEPNKLYQDRDFAIGKTMWRDDRGVTHVFAERWVRDGRSWYTRSTGFITAGKVAS